MAVLQFVTRINASKEKVWETLWNDASYRQWTAAFSEGSYAESDWQEGSRILFLGPGGNGMFGIIEKKIPNEQMIFRHQGEIKNGVEEVKVWGEARESYYLAESDGITGLTVELEAPPDFEQYFKATFPKAMAILKQVAEQ